MKKIALIASLWLLSMAAIAALRTPEQALMVAQEYARRSGQARQTGAVSMHLSHTTLEKDGTPALYLFSQGDNGFVIVSAEDETKAVLGYSKTGRFDSRNIPANMQTWLQHYAEEIAYVQGKNISSIDSNNGLTAEPKPVDKNRYSKVLELPRLRANAHRTAATAVVDSLLDGITWNQGAPYWNQCPTDPANSSTKCYTGCVATGAAQIMRYWQHPSQGTGSHSYYWERGGKTLSADFRTTYSWANMKKSYKSGYTTTQASAVAKLMSHVGIACDMSYGGASVGGSGAQTGNMVWAMKEYFKYDRGAYVLMPDYIGYEAFEANMNAEIQASRPVLMSGYTADNAGHCFVCDGVDANGYFHINWGWEGSSDGYFSLTALDPAHQGMGGAASGQGYRYGIAGFVGIKPAETSSTAKDVIQMGVDLQLNTTSTTNGGSFGLTLHQLQNIGCTPYQVITGIAVINGNNIVDWVFGPQDFGSELPCGYYYNDLSMTLNLPQLENGTYRLAQLCYYNDSWHYINTVGDVYTYLNVSGNTVTFTQTEPLPARPTIPVDTIQINTVNYMDAYYAMSGSNPYWQMTFYKSGSTQLPEITVFIWTDSKTTISGSYDIIANNGSYQLSGGEKTDLQNGNFTLKRVEGTTGSRLKYTVQGEFTDLSGNLIVLDAGIAVQAKDASNGYPYSSITLVDEPEKDYSIHNLVASSALDTVFLNFESEAPYYHVKLLKENGELVVSDIIDFKNVFINNVADGDYTAWVRPVDSDKAYYLGEAVTVPVNVDSTTPSDRVLSRYYTNGQLCVAVKFEGSVCNDIVFAGSYNGWNVSNPNTMVKFRAVTGYDQWYAAAIEDNSANIEGKPVQLTADGTFNWNYQTGAVDTWTIVRGGVSISYGYEGESNLTNYDKSTPVVLVSGGWKNDPCHIASHDYNIMVTPPSCPYAHFEPAVIGSFNNWEKNEPMTKIGDNKYQVTIHANENEQFKFRELNDTDWTNEILYYNESEDKYYTLANFTLGTSTNLEYDFSGSPYSWAQCDQATEITPIEKKNAAEKILLNSQLMIRRDGKTFTVIGQQIQ